MNSLVSCLAPISPLLFQLFPGENVQYLPKLFLSNLVFPCFLRQLTTEDARRRRRSSCCRQPSLSHQGGWHATEVAPETFYQSRCGAAGHWLDAPPPTRQSGLEPCSRRRVQAATVLKWRGTCAFITVQEKGLNTPWWAIFLLNKLWNKWIILFTFTIKILGGGRRGQCIYHREERVRPRTEVHIHPSIHPSIH